MVCPKCGKQLPDDATVCDQCNTNLATNTVSVAVPSDFKFMDDRPDPTDDNLPPSIAALNATETVNVPQKKKLPVVVIVAGVFVVIFVILLILHFLGIIQLF